MKPLKLRNTGIKVGDVPPTIQGGCILWMQPERQGAYAKF